MDSIKFEGGCFYLRAVTCLPSYNNICLGLPLYSITALSKLQHYGSIIAAFTEVCGILVYSPHNCRDDNVLLTEMLFGLF